MKTIRRDQLRKLAEAGKLEMVSSYHYDDQDGGDTLKGPLPVTVGEYGDPSEGVCKLHPSDFDSSCGRAYFGDDEQKTIRLIVHFDCSYEFRLKDGATIGPATKGPNKARRPENARMQAFLSENGIFATPKYIPDGSLRGCWRLHNGAVKWSVDLAARLNNLGFRDFEGKPLGKYSGNGGMFSVFVRGHSDLLGAPAEQSEQR